MLIISLFLKSIESSGKQSHPGVVHLIFEFLKIRHIVVFFTVSERIFGYVVEKIKSREKKKNFQFSNLIITYCIIKYNRIIPNN